MILHLHLSNEKSQSLHLTSQDIPCSELVVREPAPCSSKGRETFFFLVAWFWTPLVQALQLGREAVTTAKERLGHAVDLDPAERQRIIRKQREEKAKSKDFLCTAFDFASSIEKYRVLQKKGLLWEKQRGNCDVIQYGTSDCGRHVAEKIWCKMKYHSHLQKPMRPLQKLGHRH